MADFIKGKFRPKFPKKYKGNPTQIVFRSSWEYAYMKWLDENSSVLSWSSEPFAIPYQNPITGRWHRYFPDFKVTFRTKNNRAETWLVEIKPWKQTQEPKRGKRITPRFLAEVREYGKNIGKWEAAKKYCNRMGWRFVILTEKELNINY